MHRPAPRLFLALTLLGLPAPLGAQPKSAATAPATAASQPAFRPVKGQRVEALRFNQWHSATVKDVRGENTLIHVEPFARLEEWVPTSTLRKYTRAGKYPMPATDAEIDAYAAPIRRPHLPRLADAPDPAAPADPKATPPAAAAPSDDFFKPADQSSAQAVTDHAATPFAGLAPDPLPAAKSASARPVPVFVPRTEFGTSVTPRQIVFAPALNQAVLLSDLRARGKAAAVVQRFDLTAGQSLGAGTMTPYPSAASHATSGTLRATDVSPDGKRLCCVLAGRFGAPDAVEVWSLEQKDPRLLVAFQPDSDPDHHSDVVVARFTDANHLLTLAGNRLTLWEVPAAKAVYVRTFPENPAYAIRADVSPTAKYVALVHSGTVRLYETATGKDLGRLPQTDGVQPSVLAFSPSGRRLAAAAGNRVLLYDLEHPAIAADFPLPVKWIPSLDTLSDDYLLINGGALVDVGRRMILWTYYYGPPAALLGDRLYFAGRVPNTADDVLASAVLPTPDALAAAASATPDQLDALYAVKPGTPVALDVNVGLPADEQQKVTASLTAALRAAGLTPADNAPVRLVASTSTGDSRNVTYTFNGRRPDVTVAAAQHTYTLTLTFNGQPIWDTKTLDTPSSGVWLESNETVEQILEKNRVRHAVAFYQSQRPPTYVANPDAKPGFGSTKLAPAPPPSTPSPTPTPKRPPPRK